MIMEQQDIENSVKTCIESMQAFNDEMDKLGGLGIMASMASINIAPHGEEAYKIHIHAPVEVPLRAIMTGIEQGVDMADMNISELANTSVIPACLMLAGAFDSLSARYADYAEQIQKEFPKAVDTGEGADCGEAAEDGKIIDLGSGMERLPAQSAGSVLG